MDDAIIQESLGTLVANQIRQMIWNKEVKLGERLIENDLATLFDVSRSTIRDAFKILEYEELITTKHRKGTYVTNFSEQDYQEIIEMRIMVESYAFLKALPLLTEDHFEDLEKIIQEMRKQTIKQNWFTLFKLDIEFHKYIINLCDNTRIIKFYDAMQTQILTYLIYLDQLYSSYESFVNEQVMLLDAMKTKDRQVVQAELKKHIKYVEEILITNNS